MRKLVGVGDSVPAGTACDCRSFVTRVANRIGNAQGRQVHVSNRAVPGLTSSRLRASLREDDDLVADLRSADVVLVTIGANDFHYRDSVADRCTAGADCYQKELRRTTADVAASLRRIWHLTRWRTRVLVTGYWNVWQDGAVARSQGSNYVRMGRALTTAVNNVLRSSARAHGATYVDLWRAFGGGRDDTALLAPDGDHPNARGHRLIASTILRAAPALLGR